MKNKGFIGPAELIITLFALFLDALSFIFTITTIDVYLIPSLILIIGGFILGLLMFICTGSAVKKQSPQDIQKNLDKKTDTKSSPVSGFVKKKLLKKLGIASIGEIIPILGGFLPVWSISVYLHFKEVNK